MYDFPNSPTLNQTVKGPKGAIYQWDGTKWITAPQSGLTALLASPQFTGTPTAPTQGYGDNTTVIATDAFVQNAVVPVLKDAGRNFIHNPMFIVRQRGNGPWTTAFTYTADRWMLNLTTDTNSVTTYQIVDLGRAQIGDEEAVWGLANAFTGTSGAGAFSALLQRIENVRRLSGKTVTVSFWSTGAAGLKLGVSVDQGFGTGGSPSAYWRSTGQAVTLTGSWTWYSLTFTLPSTVGMTLGTNNDHFTQLNFWYSSGSTFASNAGNVGVQSGQINLWGVQLEVGSIATPLEKIKLRYDVMNCQRFYCAPTILFGSYNVTSGNYWASCYFPVWMRAQPTVAYVGTTYGASSSLATNSISRGSVQLTSTCTTTGPVWTQTTVNASADL